MKIVAPKGLKPKSKKLWTGITTKYEMRPDELRVLEDSCREVDLIDRLQEELDRGSLMIEGSMRQLVPNPLIAEIRQHRATLQRLLSSLKLPDLVGDDGKARGAEERSTSARNAANARWGNARGG